MSLAPQGNLTNLSDVEIMSFLHPQPDKNRTTFMDKASEYGSIPEYLIKEAQEQDMNEKLLRDTVSQTLELKRQLVLLEELRNELILKLRQGESPLEWVLLGHICGMDQSTLIKKVKKYQLEKASTLESQLAEYNAAVKANQTSS